MITLEEVIRTFIRYNGSRQGLWTDYGTVFDGYLCHYSGELRNCSMFERYDRPNTLAIRYRYIREFKVGEFTIYRTDKNGDVIRPVCAYRDDTAAADKFLELYYEENPTYAVKYDKENDSLEKTRL